MLQHECGLFVLRFHFTEVFEDSCHHLAKTNNRTKETGVQTEARVQRRQIDLLQVVSWPEIESLLIPGLAWRSLPSCTDGAWVLLSLLFIMRANNASYLL